MKRARHFTSADPFSALLFHQ